MKQNMAKHMKFIIETKMNHYQPKWEKTNNIYLKNQNKAQAKQIYHKKTEWGIRNQNNRN